MAGNHRQFTYQEKLKIKRLYIRNQLKISDICDKLPQFTNRQISSLVYTNKWKELRDSSNEKVDAIVQSSESRLLASQAEFETEVADLAQSLTLQGMEEASQARDGREYNSYVQGSAVAFKLYRDASGLNDTVKNQTNNTINLIHAQPLRSASEPHPDDIASGDSIDV